LGAHKIAEKAAGEGCICGVLWNFERISRERRDNNAVSFEFQAALEWTPKAVTSKKAEAETYECLDSGSACVNVALLRPKLRCD
jgi:hypothetical protein